MLVFASHFLLIVVEVKALGIPHVMPHVIPHVIQHVSKLMIWGKQGHAVCEIYHFNKSALVAVTVQR